ncbi:nuclear transport factor 2 family protein [Blastococcus sp. KM273128]|uniref:nuclear transport factor 2 family protein n=1 Tax=Blastococcus sp. KM273128 TaxID=2570314 RepID=UPI001F220779|nr:nuclear transport factor 2 family protein [Blastococcus sp. KM273128]
MPADREELLRSLYAAFHTRDVAAVLAAMSPAVDWPDGWRGGRLAGRDAVGRYWEALWAEVSPHVRPTAFTERDDGTVEVAVHQVFRDRAGTILEISDVRHVYTFDDDGLVARMDTGST